MKGKTHAVGGLITAAATIGIIKHYQLNLELDTLDLFIGAFFGSLLPDIDHKKSMLGSILHLPVKHRTLTHSLLFLFVISIFVIQYELSLGSGLFLGIFSHLVLDMAGPKSNGIMLFYPSKKKYSFNHLP